MSLSIATPMALLYVRVSHGRVKAESGYVCYFAVASNFVLLFLTAASVAARADEVIGVASAVRNNVSGSLPTGEFRSTSARTSSATKS